MIIVSSAYHSLHRTTTAFDDDALRTIASTGRTRAWNGATRERCAHSAVDLLLELLAGDRIIERMPVSRTATEHLRREEDRGSGGIDPGSAKLSRGVDAT
jgi:hypothetical protein